MSVPEREITLKDQWKLALAIASDPALSRGDVAIALHIVDRFFKRKGNARASHNLLADKAGISRRNTVHSLKRLLAGGYFEVQAKGRRGRATEYVPNFKLVQIQVHLGVADDTATENPKGVADDNPNAEYGVADDTLMANTVSQRTSPPTYLAGL